VVLAEIEGRVEVFRYWRAYFLRAIALKSASTQEEVTAARLKPGKPCSAFLLLKNS